MKTKLTILRRQPALVAALLLTNSLSALGDGDLRIDSWTIAGGSTVADGTFSISGTIGHANAGGVSADPAFAVQGGFWAGAAKVVSVQTKTWVGPANGDWYGPTNWSPAGVPGLYDTIIVTSGTVNLTAPVTIGGQFNWSGGTLTGSPLTIASSGVLKIN
ncbi:MAG: hypothetical protein NT154_16695, partial [Verrucomicrobia bacterium]|nr:hypothetical protein [Verrucomicrobiota bacterium]